jgi:hypothetical protein
MAWLKQEWQGVLVVLLIGMVGGFAGSAPLVLWFYRGVCG